jgi:HTH-type transcriptional regulator/antitoxin HigA
MALSRIDHLMDAEPGTAEMDELELLTALVEMYEERHFPISPPDPIDAIKFRMEQLGLGQKDMVPFIGTKSKVSEVLNGKRTLTLVMIEIAEQRSGYICRGAAEGARCEFSRRDAGHVMVQIPSG